MAKPLTIYLIKWQSFHESTDIQCWIEIADYDNLIPDDEAQDVYLLQPAGEPARLSVIDNDENIFKVIRGQQLTIQFVNTFNYNFATFAEGSDRRWGVHYFIGDNTKTVFKGWLNIDDIQEPLLPYGGEVVTLTANDGLGSLRDIPLTNDDSEVPKGKYRISQLLAYCLKKTGYELELRVALNIKQWGDTDDISTPNSVNEHLFTTTYLDSLSFEEEIGKLENCYDVIEKILGHEAWLFQSKGQWWIVRVDEVEQTRGLYVTSFDADGEFIGNLGEISFDKSIGASETIRLSEEASIIKNNRPKKSVRLNYKYETPAEVPANVSLTRGDLRDTVSSTQRNFVLDDWTKLWSNTSTDDPANDDIYIRRNYNANGDETERFVVIEGSSEFTFIMSEPIPVHESDRVEIDQNRRISSDIGGSGFFRDNCVQLRLYANDGTFYTHHGKTSADDTVYWESCNSDFRNNQKFHCFEGDLSQDLTESQSLYSGEVAPVPKDGFIRVLLYRSSLTGMDTRDTYIEDFTFRYIPYIAGSYQLFNAQYSQTDRGNTDYAAKIEDDVAVSDSPKILFKGALLKISSYNTVFSGSVTFTNLGSFAITGSYITSFYRGQILRITNTTNNNETEARVTSVAYSLIGGTTTVFIDKTTVAETDGTTTIEEPVFSLASEFYNAAVFPSGTVDTDYNQRYGRIQLFDVWNQNYYDMRAIDGTMQGLDLSELDADDLPDIASMLNKWQFTDGSENLQLRYWMLLSYDQNHDNAGWTGYFREVFQTGRDKDYSNFEFKYVEQ